MSKVINDIPFSDMSHNSRVFRLHNRMKESQSRFSEAQKGKKKGDVVVVISTREEEDTADDLVAKKYDDYIETLKKKTKHTKVAAVSVPEHIFLEFNKYLFAFLEFPPKYNRQVIVSCPSPSILKIEKMLDYKNPKKIGLKPEILGNGDLCKSMYWHFHLISIAKNIKKEDIRIMYLKNGGKLRSFLYVWSSLQNDSEYIQEVQFTNDFLFTNDFQINPY